MDKYINRVIHGDCLEVMKGMPDGCVNAIVTDPPHAIPMTVMEGRTICRNIGDLSIVEAGLNTYFEEAYRIVNDCGRIFICCDAISYPVLFRVLYGKWYTSLLIWDKGYIGSEREFGKSHELIIYGRKPDSPIFLNGRSRSDVLRVDPIRDKRLHPAEKPIELIKQFIEMSGDLILDPFCGSGTTLVAAKMLGRRYIGIDTEKKYCDIAEERLKNTTPHTCNIERDAALKERDEAIDVLTDAVIHRDAALDRFALAEKVVEAAKEYIAKHDNDSCRASTVCTLKQNLRAATRCH